MLAASSFPKLAGFFRTSGGNLKGTLKFLLIPFTDSVGLVLNSGGMSGCRIMRSDRDRLEITPGATWSSASYSIHVYNLSLKQLTQWQSRFDIQNL